MTRIKSKNNKSTASVSQKKCQHQGRVVTRFGAELIILNEQNEHIRCTARRKFENIACGDYVFWQHSEQGNSIVTSILPRRARGGADVSGRGAGQAGRAARRRA